MTGNFKTQSVLVPKSASISTKSEIAEAVLLVENVVIEADTIVERGVIFVEGGTKRTTLRARVRVGAGAVIGPNVELGWGAYVMPGSVVLGSVPANAIVQGNPAKIVGYTNDVDSEYSINGMLRPTESLEKNRHEVSVESLGVGRAALYRMPRFSDLRGTLTVGAFGESFPFIPERYFVVFDVPSEELRGEHAHKVCQQFLVCVRGSCRAMLDDGKDRIEVALDRPDIGLHMPPLIWGTQYRYTHDAVLLVLASHPYDPDDYIRTYQEFRAVITRSGDDSIS